MKRHKEASTHTVGKLKVRWWCLLKTRMNMHNKVIGIDIGWCLAIRHYIKNSYYYILGSCKSKKKKKYMKDYVLNEVVVDNWLVLL